jgi:predicted nucleic acid-binding protein
LATHLADTSALVRVHHDDVAARTEPMFVSGRIATCGIVDLELLRTARRAQDHADIRLERAMLPRAPITEAVLERAIEVQGQVADRGLHRTIPLGGLIIAAAAEAAGLTVLHYDRAFDRIAEVTGQATEWVVAPGTVP